ncbi:hypothetical protein AVEN_131611-1 [Araneus ventricosus]|uniref:Uncharacterized protein n=1 Tax=Araneus ventricosus TaxID=182803 RepID=A0A4Y2ESI4_ARAVE|nr:hypothetical protein AVEN_131611-1 [Araneus ventricosus]
MADLRAVNPGVSVTFGGHRSPQSRGTERFWRGRSKVIFRVALRNNCFVFYFSLRRIEPHVSDIFSLRRIRNHLYKIEGRLNKGYRTPLHAPATITFWLFKQCSGHEVEDTSEDAP